jgi:hypothetical protein
LPNVVLRADVELREDFYTLIFAIRDPSWDGKCEAHEKALKKAFNRKTHIVLVLFHVC